MIEVVAIDEPALVHELGRAASSRIYVGSLIGDAWQRIDPADARATFKLLHSETPWVVAPSGLPDGVRDARKWPAQNRWWQFPEVLMELAASSAWCLVPWGPLARALGLAAMVRGGASKKDALIVKRGRDIINLETACPEVLARYDLPLKETIGTRGVMFVENPPWGRIVAGAFSRTKEVTVCTSSPATLAFLKEDDIEACETQFGAVRSIDGGRRQSVPWIYKPRNQEAIREMFRLAHRDGAIVACCGMENVGMIITMHTALQMSTWPRACRAIMEAASAAELVAAMPLGPQDFAGQLVCALEQERLLSEDGGPIDSGAELVALL